MARVDCYPAIVKICVASPAGITRYMLSSRRIET